MAVVQVYLSPSTLNPLYSYDRALKRRNLVLQRMLEENYITREEYDSKLKLSLLLNITPHKLIFSALFD